MTAWPFEPLKMFGYDLVMVDPPWPFEHRSPKGEEKSFKKHYGEMPLHEIKALPIGHLIKVPGVCALWCTSPRLRDGFDVLEEWGFRYGFTAPWVKQTRHGKTAFGTGYLHRSAAEFLLIGLLGSPNVEGASTRNVIFGEAREHSRKPEAAFEWCERYLPMAYRAEVFSRASRAGWDTFGYEAGKFDPVVTLNAPERAAA